MNRIGRIALAVAAALPLAVLVGPFLNPLPPLKGMVPPQALADPDSQFIQINGLNVHVPQEECPAAFMEAVIDFLRQPISAGGI